MSITIRLLFSEDARPDPDDPEQILHEAYMALEVGRGRTQRVLCHREGYCNGVESELVQLWTELTEKCLIKQGTRVEGKLVYGRRPEKKTMYRILAVRKSEKRTHFIANNKQESNRAYLILV